MNIVPYSDSIEASWDQLVKASPDGFCWSLSCWRKVILGVGRWGLEDHSFALSDGNRLLGVMPLQFTPTNRVMSSSGWGSCGPIAAGDLSPKQRKKVLSLLFEHADVLARKVGAVSLSFSVPPITETSIQASWGINPFLEFGFTDQSCITRIIDLSLTEEKLWKALSETARHTINKAQKAGLAVVRLDWLAELDTYYSLHKETYQRTGVPPHPREYFEGIAVFSAKAGHSILWGCLDSHGNRVAFHNTSFLGKGGIYNTGCSTTQALETGANYLLFWEVLRGMKALGVRWYECGTVFPGETKEIGILKRFGLTVFKSKFGGENHRSFRCEKIIPQVEPKGHGSGAKRAAFRSFLQASRQMLEAFAGKRVADLIGTGARRSINFFTHSRSKITKWVFSIIAPRVPFIRPYWFEDEHSLISHPVTPWTEKDERNWEIALRWHLKLEKDSLLIDTGSGRTAIKTCLEILSQLHPERKKVILPSYGCMGTLSPILESGLTPIFVDSNNHLGPSHEQIIELLDTTVLACLIPHLCGLVLPDKGISKRIREVGAYLIEDLCQAPGALSTGYMPHFRVFSFCFGKTICATSGGLLEVLCHFEEFRHVKNQLARHDENLFVDRYHAFMKRCVGTTFWAESEHQEHPTKMLYHYGKVDMATLDKRLMMRQLERLEEVISLRQKNATCFREALSDAEDIVQALPSTNNISSKFPLIFKTPELRNRFGEFMAERNIETEGMYIPLHQRCETILYATVNSISGRYKNIVNIPVRPNLTRLEIDHILSSVKRFIACVKS